MLAPAGTSQHGRMTHQRSIRATVALTLLLLLASAVGPLAAGANSLLSGYGGPGQGNQAILGAALVGGRSGGSTGGGSGNAGSGGEPSLSLGSGAHEAGKSDSSPARARAGGGGRAAGASVTARRHSNGTSAGGSSPYPDRLRAGAAPAGSGSSSALGLSGADALYILLALGVLILTAVLTRRLARQPG